MSMHPSLQSNQKIIIQPLVESYIEPVVSLHQLVLGETLNSRLGKRHLENLYYAMLQSRDCFVGVALSETYPVGFISGALSLDTVKSLLFRNMPLDGWKNIALRFIRYPDFLLEWRRGNQVGRPILLQGKRVNSILTTIGVDPDFQGLGIGKKLIRELEIYFKKNGVTAYRLDTLRTNHQARTFYEALGFVQADIRADSIIFLKELN